MASARRCCTAPTHPSEVVAVEQPFSVEVGRVVLRGVVDRLELVTDDDGTVRVRVVDLKTGRSQVALGEAARHAQLGAYQVAVEAGAVSYTHLRAHETVLD